MNIPITIPKEITKGEELVIIPRKLFEEFSRAIKKQQTTSSYIDKGLSKALQDIKRGKIVGPFGKAKNLIKSLRLNK